MILIIMKKSNKNGQTHTFCSVRYNKIDRVGRLHALYRTAVHGRSKFEFEKFSSELVWRSWINLYPGWRLNVRGRELGGATAQAARRPRVHMGCGNSLPLGHSSEVLHAVRKVEDQHACRPHRGHPHPNYVGVSIGYRPLQSKH
jgi:hypothetical protein